MKRGTHLTDVELLRLKKEINFLLWTNDPPVVPEEAQFLIAPNRVPEPVHINMQCCAHVVVTTALLARRGFSVTTRAGATVVLETSPDGDPNNDCLNQIAKHWWLSLDGHGLVDLSLFAETENPLIYCNRSVGGDWNVIFGDGTDKLAAFVRDRRRGCLYITAVKKRVSPSDTEQTMSQLFPPAKAQGIFLPYLQIVNHCENLLTGASASLTSITQAEAWQKLQSGA